MNPKSTKIRTATRKTSGFSLIELVIVVVIIAIIGAIAIPRLSRGSAGAADSSLIGNLRVLRSAIDLYAGEHGGTFPAAGTITAQLTQYTDDTGATSATKTGNYIFGPYIRTVPPLPVGAQKGQSGIAAATAATVGWIYDATNGSISANTAAGEVDAKGTLYSAY
jgi:prepilin-type N-terminal cleavage/methylation domain-containing protein